MGCFSWKFADSKRKRLRIGETGYLLVPEEFQDEYGPYIMERFYDGYGMFGGYDVFDLVAIWNQKFLPYIYNLLNRRNQRCCDDNKEIAKIFCEKGYTAAQEYVDACIDSDKLTDRYHEDWLRIIGIDIACYDEDNARLPYPIKITSVPIAYKDAKPSDADPNQGF